MNPNESLILTQIRRLLILIFPVSIIVDLISGFFTVQLHTYIPICQLLRIFIMVGTLYLLTKRVSPIIIWVAFIPIIFVILISPFWMITGGLEPEKGYNLGVEIESFSKSLYFLIIVTFFIVYRREINTEQPLRIISIYGLLIAGAVIISFVTGYGNSTHNEEYGFGTKSYFKAGNDLGLTILYASVVSSLYMFSHLGLKRALITLTISLSAILIGTRVGLIGIAVWLTIMVCYTVFIFSPTDIRKRNRFLFYKPMIFFGFILCAIECIKFILSSFDKYMLVKYTMEAMMTARSLLTAPVDEYISNLEWYDFAFGRGMSTIYHYVAQSLGNYYD